jgi:hypothetical protein
MFKTFDSNSRIKFTDISIKNNKKYNNTLTKLDIDYIFSKLPKGNNRDEKKPLIFFGNLNNKFFKKNLTELYAIFKEFISNVTNNKFNNYEYLFNKLENAYNSDFNYVHFNIVENSLYFYENPLDIYTKKNLNNFSFIFDFKSGEFLNITIIKALKGNYIHFDNKYYKFILSKSPYFYKIENNIMLSKYLPLFFDGINFTKFKKN